MRLTFIALLIMLLGSSCIWGLQKWRCNELYVFDDSRQRCYDYNERAWEDRFAPF
jgi:hypothetical protein